MRDDRSRPGGFGEYAPGLVWLSLLGLAVVVQGSGSGEVTLPASIAMMITTLVQLGAASVFHPFLASTRRRRIIVMTFAAAVVLLAPFLIPEEARVLRFITACASVLVVMKLWDLHVTAGGGVALEWAPFIAFVVNPFAVVHRKQREEERPAPAAVRADLVLGGAGSILGIVAVFTLHLVDWHRYPLLLEHAVKGTVIFVAILSWFRAGIAVVRLSGGVMRDFSRAPLLARTPADFWRRYNRVLQQYFFENVFKPAGGRRSPRAVVIVIFLLSAAIHEYVFGIAIGRVQGFQTAFFLIQGLAVAATMRVKPKGKWAVAGWTVATLAFNLVTSMLFFLSFHAIVKLYANPLPSWLQR